MKIGIYGRKSVFSDKSESIENQFKMGAEYAYANYDNPEIIYYKDEGESGSYLERPDFQNLLNDVIANNIDVLICYKLDRISRDVADFGAVYKLFMAHGIEIIPLRDNIIVNENMTPIEKAMMYMNAIFSQVERENTVIRVTDNMVELAKNGYWPGGRPPIGFSLQQVVVEGKKHTILSKQPEGMEFYNMLADTFLNGHTLSSLETYFRKIDVKTLNGSYLSSIQIYNILKSPFYAPADTNTYDYFASLGCKMIHSREEYNGEYGLIVYGRTSGGRKRKHVLNPPEKWIVSIGKHTPVISSDKWLAIQNRFGQNTINKTRKYNVGILNGILRCSCGALMKTKHKYDKQYDVHYFHYACQNRQRRGPDYCTMPMISVDTIDSKVIEILKSIQLDRTLIDKYVVAPGAPLTYRSPESLTKEISIEEKKINNLTASLADAAGSTAAKYIIAEMENHDSRLNELKKELREVRLERQKERSRIIDKEEKYQAVCRIVNCLETASYEEINTLLQETLKECMYDGEVLHIKL